MSDYTILKKGQIGKGLLIEHDAGFISPDEPRNHQFVNEIKKLDNGNKLSIVEPLYVYVVLQKYDVLNKNGRIYPESVLKKQNEIYQEAIREKRAVGESEHPERTNISSDRVSHNIIETWWEGKTLMGKMQIIMSPGFINYGIITCEGDRIANLLRNGIKVGVSSRGIGSLVEGRDGALIVQDDFEIICWDIVITPSTPGSWMDFQKENLNQYTESEQKKGHLLESINEKLDKFLL